MIDRFFRAFARLSLLRPWTLLLLGLVAFAAAAPFAAQLYGDLHTDLRELLPRGAKAAVALDALEARVGGLAHLSVVIDTGNLKAGERFADALVQRLQKLPPGMVQEIRYRVDDERAFLDAHGALFVDVHDLEQLRDALVSRTKRARGLANPLLIDLDDEGDAASRPGLPAPKPVLGPAEESAIESLRAATSKLDHFIDGYLAGENGHTLAVLVKPPRTTAGVEGNRALMRAVESAVAELRPHSFDPSLRVGYDGEVREVLEAQEHLVEDLALSGILVLFAVAAAILLYYRSLRALPLLVAPLFTGVALTLAVSRFTIHYLNPNTAFLGSIIVGNGINAGIILLARYLEERRSGRPIEEALPTALSSTWLATLAASGAAAASYASLATTSFRGFNQFAVMGAMGMLICWTTTYALMPPLIVVTERVKPFERGRALGKTGSGGAAVWFARGLTAAPRAAALISLILTVGAAVLVVRFAQDPLEYDFSKLQSRQGEIDGAASWSKRLDAVMQSYETPSVILTDSPASAVAVAAALEQEKRAEGPSGPIDSIVTLQGLVPSEQPRKLGLLREIFGLLDARLLEALPDSLRELAARLRRTTELREITAGDLPGRLARLFREKDGQTGRLVLVYPTLLTSSKNGKAQLSFVRSLRRAAESAAPGALVAGTVILSAEIVETITQDGRFSASLSFGMVFVLTLLVLRSLPDAGWVLGSLCLGTVWMGGAMGALALKLNFVNFVALPITFGIGVDYAVNLYQRYREAGSIEVALGTSGGAVALCSVTTIIGYATLLVADNRAIYSFGLTAVLGEITCLSAALFALPALLAWRDRRRREPPVSA